MNDLVSIVVPIYNSEKTLSSCIDSLLNQSYKDIEIILVNDGSLDHSRDICLYYYNKNINKIVYIEKNNGGVSSARNEGIKKSKGKYICFVDSDDLLKREYVLDSLSSLKKYGSDICCCTQNISFLLTHHISKNEKRFMKFLISNDSYAVFAKMYNNNILKNKKINFNEKLLACEDAPFVRNYLIYSKKISFIPNNYYIHSNTNSSLSKKGYIDYCSYYKYKLDILIKLLNTTKFSKKSKDDFISYRAIHGVYISFYHYYNNFGIIYKDKVYDTLNSYIINKKSLKEYRYWYNKYYSTNTESIIVDYYKKYRYTLFKKIINYTKKKF